MLLIYLILNFVFNPTKVYINLNKPNDFLIHTGITLRNRYKEVRYDFRAYNENKDYITTEETRSNLSQMFPDLSKKKLEALLRSKGLDENSEIEFIYSKELFWGTSNYSIEEIMELEKGLNKNYKYGIYDCRHYTSDFCKLILNKELPIYNLESLL